MWCCGSFRSFFFFKQKTAYEMRISDWSSDVCSSDLAGADLAGQRHLGDAGVAGQRLAGLGEALHHVEDAVGQPGLGVDLRQLQRAERGQLGRLEDHGIAADRKSTRLNSSH